MELRNLLEKLIKSAGYRELEVLENFAHAWIREDGGHQILHITSKDGSSCEYAIDLDRWTN